jgi:hypothetical protein
MMAGRADGAAHWSLLVATGGAVLVGIYFRFTGLGTAPLSVDEYYLTRSIENVMRDGLPRFPCGGFYTRGLLLQYLSAALRVVGTPAELAPRLLAALASLITLPAVYILGRRAHSPTVGLLAVTVLALSVWEIEMARFGRMYAPFQLVFAWYLVFFVRLCVDRDRRALWAMWALSLLAPLVWEGGALLALLNLLPPFLKGPGERNWSRFDSLQVAIGAAVFGLVYWFVMADFRGSNAAAWPIGYSKALAFPAHTPLGSFAAAFRHLPQNPAWYGAGAAMLGLVVWAAYRLREWRRRPIAAAGLILVLLAALLHQFGAVLCILVLLMLSRHVTWAELIAKEARPLRLALLVCAAGWLVYGGGAVDWNTAGLEGVPRKIAAFLYQYGSFPDFAGVVAQPWARAVPALGLGLLLLSGAAIVRQALEDRSIDTERTLEIVFLVLLMAASASHPPRQETRYVFFLYPIAIVIAISVIARGARVLRPAAPATALIALAALGGFALSEDFQPAHLLHIDTPVEIFRDRMSLDMQGHLEIRNDYPGMAAWMHNHVGRGDLVINQVHAFDYYYPAINYFFADERDPDFPAWSCRHGAVERWGSYPLIYTVDSLEKVVARGHDTYLVFYPTNNPGLLESLARFSPRIAWAQGYVSIAVLHGNR